SRGEQDETEEDEEEETALVASEDPDRQGHPVVAPGRGGIPRPDETDDQWTEASEAGRASLNCSAGRRAYSPLRARSSGCVPRSTRRPASRTRITSARRTVDSRCAMTNTVRPVMRFCSASCTSASDSASRDEVASSRIRIGESFRIARAIEILW